MKIFRESGLVREVGIILLMTLFLALVYNFFSPAGLPLIRTAPMKVAAPDSLLFSTGRRMDTTQIRELLQESAPAPADSVVAPLHKKALANPDSVARVAAKDEKALFKTVTLAQVKRLLAEHRGLLIDARASEEFRKGHIRGSRNIPGEDISPHFPELAPLPRDTLIVVYCTGPLCNLGKEVARFLQVLEFSNVFLYDDGWEGWEKAKLTSDSASTTVGDL
jgi:rhodanese-related sulfurtransferase